MQSLLRAFYWMLIVVQCIAGIALIYIITIQESKNDGLSGQIGSTTSTSSFKGKAGKEDQLNLITKNISIFFFVVSAVVAFGTGRWDQH
jgi:protein translocase SecG subunit